MTDFERLSCEQALELYQNSSFHDLTARAAERTNQLCRPDIRTYLIERNINYTNVCFCRCSFCAFSVSARDPRAFVLTDEQIAEKIEPLIALGGAQILLQGGLHPDLSFEWYENLLRNIKQRYPDLHVHAFSPPEINFLAEKFEIPIPQVIDRLRRAGLDTIPGGGAEILVDRVRKIVSPAKCSTDQWLDVMRQTHRLGMCTTATMMFGHVETVTERIEHLDRLRRLQDESLANREKDPCLGRFTAFTCWPFQPGSTRLAGSNPDIPLAGAYEQLKMTALARLYLDNIPNIQASWVTQGPKIGQLSLLTGCNDIGSLMMEEKVVSAAGATFRLQLDQLRRLISNLGLRPVKRDCYYNLLP